MLRARRPRPAALRFRIPSCFLLAPTIRPIRSSRCRRSRPTNKVAAGCFPPGASSWRTSRASATRSQRRGRTDRRYVRRGQRRAVKPRPLEQAPVLAPSYHPRRPGRTRGRGRGSRDCICRVWRYSPDNSSATVPGGVRTKPPADPRPPAGACPRFAPLRHHHDAPAGRPAVCDQGPETGDHPRMHRIRGFFRRGAGPAWVACTSVTRQDGDVTWGVSHCYSRAYFGQVPVRYARPRNHRLGRESGKRPIGLPDCHPLFGPLRGDHLDRSRLPSRGTSRCRAARRGTGRHVLPACRGSVT